jgi:SAM-dependent methyltransferase
MEERLRHADRIKQERLWHTDHGFRWDHPLNAWPLWHPDRLKHAWHLVQRCLTPALRELGCTAGSRVLLAPCGWGSDIPYILPITKNIFGVDVSYEAVAKNDPSTGRINADIENLPFEGPTFDFVVVSGFLHHVPEEYPRYLGVLRQVLKPNGWIIVLEPSFFHPVQWITWPLRRVFGEITGQLRYERPLNPLGIKTALRKLGFGEITVRAASFSHPRFFVPVAWALSLFQDYVSGLPLIKYCGFFVLFAARRL